MNAKAISEKKNPASGCGRVGLFLFGLVFAAFGLSFIWFMLVSPILKSRAARTWSEAQCRIISSEVKVHSGDDGPTYSPDIKFEFEVGGQRFQGDKYSFSTMSNSTGWAKQIVKRYRPGEVHSCFYDPNAPNDSVLNRDLDWSGSGFVFPLFLLSIFVLVGLGVCAWAIFGMGPNSKKTPAISADADTSRHNQSSFSQTSKLNQFTAGMHPEDQLDQSWSVPQKLKPERSTWGTFLIVLGIAAFWNGIVSVFVVAIFLEEMTIWGRIGLGLFLTPFVLVGLFLLSSLVYMFMSLFNPRIEVAMSTGAVPLGGDVDIAWEIIGKANRVRKLKLEIQGEQSATYRRGTTTSTDTEIFELIPICEITEPSEIEFGSATVQIPESTMHSFDGGQNKITWSVEAVGEIAWWPDVHANYPFRVKPTSSPS